MTKTYSTRAADIQRDWYVVDVAGKVLGRAASEITRRLMGKDKPGYERHLNVGSYVVVLNADKVRVTGKKETEKFYHRHSGYIGGLRTTAVRDMRATYPERLLHAAVSGMLPKNKLRSQYLGQLKLYVGSEHPHQAQQPTTWVLQD